MKLWHIQLLIIITGLALTLPQMAPLVISHFAGQQPSLGAFSTPTIIGFIMFFSGFAIGKFREKEDRPFQLTKKMHNVDVSDQDYQSEMFDDDSN